jgi:hypothetical protein
MNSKAPFAIACLVILNSFSVTGCRHVEHTDRNIVLDGFSDRNYVELNRSLGARVCVYGRLSIDSVHHSVHFALQPVELEGIINVGFSRIISGLSYERVHRDGMADGESHRVCGTLRDATPFRQCDQDHCKWYKLENAELQ